jgi:hypothetical protein
MDTGKSISKDLSSFSCPKKFFNKSGEFYGNYNANYSSGISFRILFLLAAIIFFIFGLIFPNIPQIFYVGILMLIFWLIGNIITLILNLDR